MDVFHLFIAPRGLPAETRTEGPLIGRRRGSLTLRRSTGESNKKPASAPASSSRRDCQHMEFGLNYDPRRAFGACRSYYYYFESYGEFADSLQSAFGAKFRKGARLTIAIK